MPLFLFNTIKSNSSFSAYNESFLSAVFHLSCAPLHGNYQKKWFVCLVLQFVVCRIWVGDFCQFKNNERKSACTDSDSNQILSYTYCCKKYSANVWEIPSTGYTIPFHLNFFGKFFAKLQLHMIFFCLFWKFWLRVNFYVRACEVDKGGVVQSEFPTI